MRFRFHRGGLGESLQTMRTFHTLQELEELAGGKVTVTLYSDRPDDRINPPWEKTYVVHDKHGVLGFCDGPVAA